MSSMAAPIIVCRARRSANVICYDLRGDEEAVYGEHEWTDDVEDKEGESEGKEANEG